MPAVPDEQLQKILQQMQTQLVTSSRQLSMVKAQLQGCETGRRRVDLTSSQLQDEVNQSSDTRLWQGVGKIFVRKENSEVQGVLKDRKAEIEAEISNLTKKQKFLEKQVNEAQGHMRDLFQGLEQRQQQQAA